MYTFRSHFERPLDIPVGTSWLIGVCMEARGKQDLWLHKKPEVLQALRELAAVQSAESSNRIEGVTVAKNRLVPLIAGKTKPKDRSEEEIVGYRKALNWIHGKHAAIEVTPSAIKHLHRLAQSGFSGDAGQWKKRNNEIIEFSTTGARTVRFVPLEPRATPKAIAELCERYDQITSRERVPDLLAVAAFILDFLCIHPFRDGNGRVSRLLSLLLLYRHGYEIGRYISLERIIEESKEDYYATLHQSSLGWHTGAHDPIPFWNYFLSHIKNAYGELAQRVSLHESGPGKSDIVRQVILEQVTPFSLSEVMALCQSASPQLIKKVLSALKNEGRLSLQGRGRGAMWRVLR